mmetsp:Transcript_32964/g.81114  ORF Transcript_32964/g.81114 Transcript_32964/m.81114 type:complete len:342 (-) Transcript_32964:328-1353(-)
MTLTPDTGCSQDPDVIGQPAACHRVYHTELQQQSSTSIAGLDFIIGSTFFLLLISLFLYSCWRASRALKDARREVLLDLLEMIERSERRMFDAKLFVQATQPDGEVAAAKRCPDDEQTRGPDGELPLNPADDDNDGEGGRKPGAYSVLALNINDEEGGRRGDGGGGGGGRTGFGVCLGDGPFDWRRGGGGGGSSRRRDSSGTFASPAAAAYRHMGMQQILWQRIQMQQIEEQDRLLFQIEIRRLQESGGSSDGQRRQHGASSSSREEEVQDGERGVAAAAARRQDGEVVVGPFESAEPPGASVSPPLPGQVMTACSSRSDGAPPSSAASSNSGERQVDVVP